MRCLTETIGTFRVPIIAALAVLLPAATPAFAQGAYVDPFTLNNRAPGKTVVRDGDLSLGATFRSDERYNNGSVFLGPRGWIYWNSLPEPQG